MIEANCPFGERRDDVLIGFLYDELDPATSTEFGAHLSQCSTCRDELAALKTVRTQLKAWTPPVPGHQSPVNSHQSVAGRQSAVAWWREVPVWAQVAAALLVLGVSAGIANLNVHYDRSGLTVRTGWSTAAPPAAVATNVAPAVTVVPTDTTASTASGSRVDGATPWRADLAALEQQLRTEFHASQIGTARPSSDPEMMRRVKALLDESERKQQRELALRVAEVVRDVQNERRADLVRIEQSLGQIQNNTGVEVMKQRQLLNYLVRVSSQK